MTDYRKIAETLIEQKMKEGITWGDAHRTVFASTRGLYNALIQIETERKSSHDLGQLSDELREYISERGFCHDGVWYFRGTWLDGREYLEREGVIERVGNGKYLRTMGIIVPDSTYPSTTAMFYKLNPEKLQITV